MIIVQLAAAASIIRLKYYGARGISMQMIYVYKVETVSACTLDRFAHFSPALN